MQGILILGIYAVVLTAVILTFTRREKNALRFHVSDRNISAWASAISIAAAWIWAPSLFTASEKAYANGIAGLFWFTAPNILCLIAFIPFAKAIRKKYSNGITLSGHMTRTYGSRKVKGIYVFQLGALAVFSVGVQLFAGSKIISRITGVPFWLITILLAAVAFSYAQVSGIKASVTTAKVKMLVILFTMALVLPWLIEKTDGAAAILRGIGGISGEYGSLFGAKGWEIFLGFGLSTTIGLMSGPFGDQAFWQRAFAVKKEKVGSAFLMGALLFGLMPLSMGLLGFVAAGSGFSAADAGLVNYEFISAMLPGWVIVPFLLMIVAGLLSTVDSNLCAAASLTTDFIHGGRINDAQNLKASKRTMVALLAAGVLIANIPGVSVTLLFLFYGTLRASTMFPTVLTLLGKKLTADGVFYGILLSLCIGLPIFAVGNFANIALLKAAGSLITVLTSGLFAIAWSRKKAIA